MATTDETRPNISSPPFCERKNVRARLATLVALGAMLIFACGGPSHRTQGNVLRRAYEPAYTVLVPQYCGKGCLVFMPAHHAESFELVVYADDDVRTIAVDRYTYERAPVGARLDIAYTGGCDAGYGVQGFADGGAR